uniref:Uncharacterized protein n=1 Tax=Cryptosporidium parvum TaxID=5807 RepID=F0X4V4_CRYPV
MVERMENLVAGLQVHLICLTPLIQERDQK